MELEQDAPPLMNNGPDHIGKTEARAGTTPGVARYVLIIGTLLTIVLFAAILMYFMRG